MLQVEALVMKTRVFADDGQPESWDCNDNYFELDEGGAREHVLHWARSAASRQSAVPAPTSRSRGYRVRRSVSPCATERSRVNARFQKAIRGLLQGAMGKMGMALPPSHDQKTPY